MNTRPTVKTPSLASDTAALMGGSVVAQGTVFLTIAVVARLVPKAEVGTYQQLSLVYSLTAPLFLGGIPAALLYFLPRAQSREEVQDWITRSYVVLASLGLAAALAAVVLREPISSLLQNPRLAPALVAYAPYIGFAFLMAAATSVLVATRRARAAAILSMVTGVSTLTGVVTAALIAPTARALALGLSVAGGVSVLAAAVLIVRGLRFERRWPASPATAWTPLARFGLPLAAAGVAARVGYQFDQVVVSAHFSPARFAIYALGAVEFPLSQLLQQAVSSVLAPALTTRWQAGDIKGMIALWREALRKTTLVVAPMFAFLMVESGDLVRLAYGRAFAESGGIFRIYLLFLPIRIATWGLIPQAVGRTRVNLAAACIILPTNIVVALALVSPVGLSGPAFAAPAAALAATGYYLVAIRRITGATLRELLPVRHAAQCFGVCGCIAAMLLPLHWLAVPILARFVMTFVMCAATSVIVLRRLRLISDEDALRLRRLARRALRV